MSVSGLFYVLAVFPIHRCPVGCVECVKTFYVSTSIDAFPVWPGYNLNKDAINLNLFQTEAWKAMPKVSLYSCLHVASITLLTQ